MEVEESNAATADSNNGSGGGKGDGGAARGDGVELLQVKWQTFIFYFLGYFFIPNMAKIQKCLPHLKKI